jgi:hypothetical protein
MAVKKSLPLGRSSFKALREDNCLYIDKTEMLFQVMNNKRYNFFARPRRFGKSLLLSTLKEIFLGRKELFTDLWIGQHSGYAWPVHPVIYIDMNMIDKNSPEALEASLRRMMDRIAFEYGVENYFAESSGEKLAGLVRGLFPRGKVVILIDEYDQPITSRFPDMELAAANREVLREFYSRIKSLDEYIEFLFITGVSKFTKTSLFSGLNNLKDISFDKNVSTILGCTKEEIDLYLSEYVEEFAQVKSMTSQQVYDEMREWYNGYRFSNGPGTVYNPWSIFNYLKYQQCARYFDAQPPPEGYGGQPSLLQQNSFAGLPAEAQESEGWFASGTPTFLVQLLKDGGKYSFSDLEQMSADEGLLDTFDIDTIPLVPLLYQTGYITIKSYSEDTNRYELTYPNKEVELSLASHLLGAFLDSTSAGVQNNAEGLRQALFSGNMERFAYYLQMLFSGIPYLMHNKKESYYHSLLHVVCALLGSDVSSEIMTSVGRIDMVVSLSKMMYVIELKLDKTADEALAQIKEKRYAEKYGVSGKSMTLVGLNFEYKTKTVTVQSEIYEAPGCA